VTPLRRSSASAAAIPIFLVASAISAGVAALATRVLGGTSLGKIVATAAPILVMTIATFMILDQLQIAQNIVVITYAGLIVRSRSARPWLSGSAAVRWPAACSRERTRRFGRARSNSSEISIGA